MASGKGDTPRPLSVSRDAFAEAYERTFGGAKATACYATCGGQDGVHGDSHDRRCRYYLPEPAPCDVCDGLNPGCPHSWKHPDRVARRTSGAGA